MNRRGERIAVLLALVQCAMPLACTKATTGQAVVEVAQPVLTFDGIVVRSVPYVVATGTPAPGAEVRFTAHPNSVYIEGDGPHNLNAADVYGLTLVPKYSSRADSIGVVLDTGAMLETTKKWRFQAADVLRATVECVLVNARRSDPPVRWIWVDVRGKYENASLEATYDLESLPELPRQERFPD